jgi:hypothetical protein
MSATAKMSTALVFRGLENIKEVSDFLYSNGLLLGLALTYQQFLPVADLQGGLGGHVPGPRG